MAGMWWAAAKNTPRLNATWNLQNKSGKITIMLQNPRKRSCKMGTKELQYGYRKRWSLFETEIFFFLLNKRYRVQGHLLLRLFSFTAVGTVPHRRYLASCAKKSVRFSGTDFFAFHYVSENRPVRRKSMTLHVFGGQFYCFSAKDSSKVCCRWGLYSDGVCGKV